MLKAKERRMEVGLKEYGRRDTEILGVGYPVNHRNNPSLRRLSIRERRGAPAHSNVSLVIQHQFTPHAIMIFFYDHEKDEGTFQLSLAIKQI
jgi:hypothetical protein